ncbi:MAG: ATP-grasp domain-containing protein [Wenzhouxiangella sp.]|nr:ATP-grasp domain-containing protein [Wenzhouxiangella sp.]
MPPQTFQSILIANRGEIACRIMRTARSLGYRTVAVFSPADADAPHVLAADCAVALAGNAPSQSYLDIEQLLAAARKSNADAEHHGYGFLAENEKFARACADAGRVFIGPGPDAIARMGNKRQAKDLMEAAGVPVIPGARGSAQDPDALLAAAREVGLPVMVKAAAGGGGKGMRRVAVDAELVDAIRGAASEAASSFGDAELIIERALDRSRHVEIQVFADRHGNILHLGERDCSLQRRHQKIIEECPSPAVGADLRARMGQAAVAAARAIDYVGAGTVEFLLEDSGDFHFLEMNTRLQVEHPVTELVTGLDLVAWQIQIAAGQALPLSQEQVVLSGHAMEARLYAEAPDQGFVPQTGHLQAFSLAEGDGVRVDSGVRAGQWISPFYDPMLAKVIAHGPDRETARRRLKRCLAEARIAGLATNRAYLLRALGSKVFIDGAVTTDTIDSGAPELAAPELDIRRWAPAALLLAGAGGSNGMLGSVRSMQRKLSIEAGGEALVLSCRITRTPDAWTVAVDDAEVSLRPLGMEQGTLHIESDGLRSRVGVHHHAAVVWLADALGDIRVADLSLAAPAADEAAGAGLLRIPMDGTVVEVPVASGQAVSKGDAILVMEAMKMETTLRAAVDGVVGELGLKPGDSVRKGQTVTVIEAREDHAD